GAVRLWDVVRRQWRWQLAGPADGWQPYVCSVAFSPDGRTLLTGNRDGVVQLWEVATRQERRRFQGHIGPVLSVAFAPDGRTVLSGGADTTALLWDARGPGPGKDRR